MRKKETLKCMLVFNDRGLWLSCLVRASANLSCLLDFFLDHCLPRIHSYTVILTRFSMRLCSSLKANSARGLHSILPFQKAIINQMIFFYIFIFQKIFVCPLSQWLFTLTEALLFGDSSLWRETMRWMLTVSDPAMQEIYNKSHGH